jgi:hypothetical protein
VDIELTPEQRDRLELLAIQAGKSTPQLLLDTAQILLARDAVDSLSPADAEPPRFLSAAELEARFTRILRH